MDQRVALALLAIVCSAMAAVPHNSISSHVLDIANGRPAEGVRAFAYRLDCQGDTWKVIGNTSTDAAGRIDNIHPGIPLEAGVYKIRFETKEYFSKSHQDTFFPFVEVPFEIKDATQHYHVPITLSNFGYSTYKGQ
uniref:5-hydroxyisourate hydrolase n=1 Tax=Steinernema glaseri TaxID=37863 RepID=A0A1I8AAG0_9BILA